MIQNQVGAEVWSKKWDFCIIGSGAMGLALAVTLARAGKSVAVLEAGNEEIRSESQRFYQCSSVGHRHVGSTEGRFRVFGGSTERWGGQAMRFDPLDFKSRKGIYEEGWPLDREELDLYYAEAENFMGVSGADYEGFRSDFFAAAGKAGIDLRLLEKGTEPFQLHYSVFTHQPRLREKYRAEIETLPNLMTILEAPARKLAADPNGKVTSVEALTPRGPENLHANVFILSCGCIENARFLLLQKDVHRITALANLPMLGRCFQDHPGAHLAELQLNRGAFLQDIFRLREKSGINYKARISWNEETRERDQLLAVSGTLLMSRAGSEYDDAPSKNWFRLLDPRNWINTLRLACRGGIFSPFHRTYLAVSVEDLRDRKSRITLSETEADAFGDPLATIDWRISPKTTASVLEYLDRFENLMTSCGLGAVRRFGFTTNATTLLEHFRDNSHHMGATSIGENSSVGVVDQNLRLFGTDNFYVVGTSVLPTGSHANPTLTALALAFRLADHLLRPR